MMSSATVMPDGSLCKPNISGAGVRRRIRFGALNTVLAAVLATSAIVARSRWSWCLLVFVPATLAAIGYLQAGRKTCVMCAASGTFEHDDLSRTRAPDDDVLRSRELATRITRDSMIIGVAAVIATIVATRLR
jgi:hypothetical protein